MDLHWRNRQKFQQVLSTTEYEETKEVDMLPDCEASSCKGTPVVLAMKPSNVNTTMPL